MDTTLTAAQLGAWRNLITAHATIIEQIDRDLAAAERIPLHWYDVLVELVEAPEGRLRMSELARRVVLSRSTLTHLAARLEGEGLLSRERTGADRRGAYAVLTDAGRAALRAAWPIYSRGIASYFARHLGAAEAALIEDVFARMLTGAGPGVGPEE
jgi:DNA-binding MarR family transcriptional regulator